MFDFSQRVIRNKSNVKHLTSNIPYRPAAMRFNASLTNSSAAFA